MKLPHNFLTNSQRRFSSKQIIVGACLLLLFLLVLTRFSSSSSSHVQNHHRQQESIDNHNGHGVNKNHNHNHDLPNTISMMMTETKNYTSDYVKSIVTRTVTKTTMKHALSFPNRYQRHDAVGKNEVEVKPRILVFLGDSQALRIFRWTCSILFFTGSNNLKPESGDFVGSDDFFQNIDVGVSNEKEFLSIDLTPNTARLVRIEFRRAVFVEDAAEQLVKIGQECSSNSEEAMILMSVANWDLLRPKKSVHGFTLTSLMEQEIFARKENGQNPHQNNINIIDEQQQQHQQESSSSFKPILTKLEIAQILETTLIRWRISCEILTRAIQSQFLLRQQWDEQQKQQQQQQVSKHNNRKEEEENVRKKYDGKFFINQNQHHIFEDPRTQGNLVGSKLLWRFPGSPNCDTSRFQFPRANRALAELCHTLSERYWSEYEHVATENVIPARITKKSKHHGVFHDNPLEIYSEEGKSSNNHMPKHMRKCLYKPDGVHPRHECVAREAAAVLLRALS